MASNGLVGSLLKVLRDQNCAFINLYQITLEKRDIVIKNDVEALRALTARENAVVGRCQRLEKERLAVIKDIATVLGKNPNKVTLSYLTELIEGQPEAKEVSASVLELREILTKIKEANDQNRLLVQNALDYIDFSVNIMRSAAAGDVPSYVSPYEDALPTGGGFAFSA